MSDDTVSTNGAGPDGAGPDGADHDSGFLPARPAEPIPDPGVPPHEPRPTDVDPAMERRAERQVATMFGAATLLGLLFCVCYFAVPKDKVVLGFGALNLTLGLTLGLALLLIGIGAIQWAKKLMTDHEIIEYRHPSSSSQEDREEALAAFSSGAEESGFGRRTMVRNSLLGALGVLGLPAIVLLRDLGPLPKQHLEHTVWRKGSRVVNDVAGSPIKPSDVQLGQLVNAEPDVFFEHQNAAGQTVPAEYEGTELNTQKAKAAVILVRMQPEDIHPYKSRANWGVQGILCYSKICTHVGCPISLWEQQTHQLLCPCHQSTFDLADNGKVVFGPAARSLPQLPIGVDKDGYLIAMSDFHEPVGPSFWERG
ncbi:MAG: cytochrome bc1 complex Rieske iron-sulfur subunit [Nocardioidaceae bacterium]